MVDASIVVSVIALISSLAAALFTGWNTLIIDRVKKHAQDKALTHFKYRDPLIFAALDLQSRLFLLVEGGLLRFHADEEKRDLVLVYTAFLMGQYFSWTFILRRQAQFLRFSVLNKNLSCMLETIADMIAQDIRPGEHPFMMWRVQQLAIGEMMTEKDGDEYYCIGYSTFIEKYKEENFRKWFRPIEFGLSNLVAAQDRHDAVATYRLRRLQHRLVDLTKVLDLEASFEGYGGQMKMNSAPDCGCLGCPGRPPRLR